MVRSLARPLAPSLVRFLARWTTLSFLVAASCQPRGATTPSDGSVACTEDRLAECEAALVEVTPRDASAWVAAYAAARGEPAYAALWDELVAAPDEPLVIGAASPPEGFATAPLPPPPRHVSQEALLLALGRAAGRAHLFVRSKEGWRQLFPRDVLGGQMAGLEPVVAADPRSLSDDVMVAATLRRALERAAIFDYRGAAREAVALRDLVSARGRDDEAAMRARHGLSLLDGAGITLQAPPDAPQVASAPEDPPPFGAKSSPYAALLALQLTFDDHAGAWKRFGATVTAATDPERAAAIEQRWGQAEGCPVPFVPPMRDRGDLIFARALVQSLDQDAAPGDEAASGRLTLEDWLPRYERLVQLVEDERLAWRFVPILVQQRGSLGGLSAEGTASYTKVTGMAKRHIEALGALAAAEPARFQTLGPVNLAYAPGVLADRALSDAVTELAQRSVALKLEAAADTDQLWEAAIAAFAIGMGYPAALQGPHFAALRQGLAAKLDGGMLKVGGWSVAGLAAGNAALGLLLGDRAALSAAAPKVAEALAADPDISYPGVARLVQSAIRYAELVGSGALDADVSNPKMFPEPRQRARAALQAAVTGLAEVGPQTLPEKDYAEQLAAMVDGLIVALIAETTSPADEGVQCASEGDVSPSLRDAFDRLQKSRQLLLDHRAQNSGEASVWLRRARLLALLSSDLLDALDPKAGRARLRIDNDRARQIVRGALDGWAEAAGIEVVSSLYLVGRGALGEDAEVSPAMVKDGLRALRGLAKLFGGEGSSGSTGLFAKLASIGSAVDLTEGAQVEGLLVTAAKGAYATQSPDQGDLLLMLALGAALVRSEPVDDAAVRLARESDRPVLLPLLLYGKTARQGGDPEPIVAAMRDAVKAGCRAPDPQAMIASREAIWAFKRGERRAALTSLERILDDAERRGLTVPRQVFQYQQMQGDKIFNAQQSVSLGGHLLAGSGSFQVGLGLQSRPRYEGHFEVRFADADTRDAQTEAARYYAHLAAVAAVYAFVDGQDQVALRHATRAVGAWVNGVRLGDDRVPAGAETVSWARDATATLTIAAQLAAEADQPMLAGDLWTLAQAALGPEADDETVAETLEPLPAHLRGIPELDGLTKRAAAQLETVAGKLACTKRTGDVADLQRVSCGRYPTALALRIADALPYLPRLKSGAAIGKPACGAWKQLDEFLGAYDEGRYEPKALTSAVDLLHAQGHRHVAATLLTRQRVPRHCTPELVRHARKLSEREELGVHLRADLLSVAANCSSPAEIAEDLAGLDALTRRHADPTRSFEVLIFASKLAAEKDMWRPLYAMTRREGFIRRWQQLSPELAVAALLLHHAAAVGVGEPIEADASLPYYRLLCTTFPSKPRGPLCDAVALLRGSGARADKKAVARQAVRRFVERAVQPRQPSPTP